MPAVVNLQSPAYSYDEELKIGFGAEVRTLRLSNRQVQLLERFIKASLAPDVQADFTRTEMVHVNSLAAMLADVAACSEDTRDTIHHLCL